MKFEDGSRSDSSSIGLSVVGSVSGSMSFLSCGSKWWRLAGQCSQIASLVLFNAAAAVVWRCFMRLHLSFEVLACLRCGSVGRGLCVAVCCRCCRFSLQRFGQEELHFRVLEVFGWSQ